LATAVGTDLKGNHFPVLQRIPGRIIGLGFRPKHIAAPGAAARRENSSR